MLLRSRGRCGSVGGWSWRRRNPWKKRVDLILATGRSTTDSPMEQSPEVEPRRTMSTSVDTRRSSSQGANAMRPSSAAFGKRRRESGEGTSERAFSRERGSAIRTSVRVEEEPAVCALSRERGQAEHDGAQGTSEAVERPAGGEVLGPHRRNDERESRSTRTRRCRELEPVSLSHRSRFAKDHVHTSHLLAGRGNPVR